MQPLNREKQLETMLTIALGLFVVYWTTKNKHFFQAALLVGIIGLFFKSATQHISAAWMKLGEAMGAVSSRIILSIIYFLFLFPIAVVYRLSRKDELQLRKTSGSTYFISHQMRYTAKDLKNPW